MSGCINQSGLLKIRVTKPFEQSTVSKILELVEEASERKSKSEAFITRFAKYYTPFVVIAAVLLSILPPILTGNLLNGAVWLKWVSRALTFLDYLLSVCTGHLCPPLLLWRHWRCIEKRYSHQRQQLLGGSRRCQYDCI